MKNFFALIFQLYFCILVQNSHAENCTCPENFERDRYEVCVPICDPPCVQGVCVEPNECSCLNGFEGIACDIGQFVDFN